MEVFEKAFNWLANLSSKMPAIDFKTYFIVVVAVIAGLGVIIAFTLLGTRAAKLKNASKKIIKYLAGVESVNDENVEDFTSRCFSAKAPQPLRESWVQYLGVKYGYPSDIVNDQSVYDKMVKKNRDIRPGIFAAIALVVLAFFAFWGFGALERAEMGVIHCVGLLMVGLIYFLLVVFSRAQSKHCQEKFDTMLEDLDAKVNLQVESNYAVDNSPLTELSAMVDEIVARNTSKEVELDEEEPVEEEEDETPIEALIAQEEAEELADAADEEEPTEEPVEESEEELAEEVEEPVEEVVEEEVVDEDVVEEELVEDEPVEDAQEELVEETVEEESDEGAQELEEEPAEEESTDELEEESVEEDALDETVEEEVSDEEEYDEEEGDESAPAPSRYAKLPQLLDYMLEQKMPKLVKIKMASALLTKFAQTTPGTEDRKVLLNSLGKVILSLAKQHREERELAKQQAEQEALAQENADESANDTYEDVQDENVEDVNQDAVAEEEMAEDVASEEPNDEVADDIVADENAEETTDDLDVEESAQEVAVDDADAE